jgi:hypothetical protein
VGVWYIMWSNIGNVEEHKNSMDFLPSPRCLWHQYFFFKFGTNRLKKQAWAKRSSLFVSNIVYMMLAPRTQCYKKFYARNL